MYTLNCLLVCALLCFLYGFFPLSLSPVTFSNDPPTQIGNITVSPHQFYKPNFEKTVLVVIDALRWDFVTPHLMPLTVKMINQRGCLSKVLVESPTVTLPRIKALTTGSVPQYVDVIRNLASSELLQDSWLHSAKKRGLKTVFYGDNTWEKLFPGLFTRSKGTTSFFVWDFFEVDNNVTVKAELELHDFDWDIMVLHYLGLDHIGHVLGPFSPKISTKLQEMDQVIHKIFTKTSSKFETLILVTGDHGMRDSGGHGGTSHAEVTVPLIALGLDCKNSTFLQTDIPANLAVLLGLDIPSSSIGNLQPSFLKLLNTSEYLYSLRYNTETLIKKTDPMMCANIFSKATVLHEQYMSNGHNIEEVVQLYENCSKLITRHLYESTTKQNMLLMLLAVLSLFYIVLMLVGKLYVTLFVVPVPIALLHKIENEKNVSFVNMEHQNFKAADGFVIALSLFQPLTFVSTSYIEEEHYFWIFTSVTLVAIKALQVWRTQNKNILLFLRQKPVHINLNLVNILSVMLGMRFCMDLNSTVENTVQNDSNLASILSSEGNQVYYKFFFLLGLFVSFFAVYNQSNLQNYLTFTTLSFIFILKCLPYHSALLGKLLWVLIGAQLFFMSPQIWVLSSILLIKPHNVILIPLALHAANTVLPSFQNGTFKAAACYMLSNAFYFMQGHRNSLASVDVSVGYTGLISYQPIIVIVQILMHTYTFPVLFHLIALKNESLTPKDKEQFWTTLLAIRALVVLLFSVITLTFRHHLFVWSVFAPKLIIESVHTIFLFVEITWWCLYRLINTF